MNNNDNLKNIAYKTLEQIIAKAIKTEADSITLEYADEGLEVGFVYESEEIAEVIDFGTGYRIIGLIIAMAKLDNKTKGTIVWINSGKKYKIDVEEYDNFGESSYKLILNKAKSDKPYL